MVGVLLKQPAMKYVVNFQHTPKRRAYQVHSTEVKFSVCHTDSE